MNNRIAPQRPHLPFCSGVLESLAYREPATVSRTPGGYTGLRRETSAGFSDPTLRVGTSKNILTTELEVKPNRIALEPILGKDLLQAAAP